MNVKYYLAKNSYNKTTILISISHNSNRVRFSSGLSIEPKNWNSKIQKVKSNATNSIRINQKLMDIEKYIIDNYEINNKKIINLDNVKKEVLSYISDYKNTNINTFNYYYDEYLKDNFENNKFKKSTIKQKKATQSFINKLNSNLMIDELDINFFESFTKFLINKGYTNVYVKKQINQVKAFLNNYAVPKKIVTNLEYLNYSLKELPKNYTTFISLSEEEIDILKGLELPERLDKVRDLFVFQCYTGLRVSDLLKLKKENFNIPNKILDVYTLKTSKVIQIPLVDTTMKILEKYNFNLPVISDVKYNKYIKEICSIAGFNEIIYNIKHVGKEKIEYSKPKYEMITSHTARRTFITRLLRKGAIPEQIMNLSGHTNRVVFDNYVKITQNESINIMRNLL